jgi:NhaP-type Na+/H+ and K+/H+ antiporter
LQRNGLVERASNISRFKILGDFDMTSEDSSLKHRTSTDVIKQFLLGIAFGLLLALIPLSYISISVIEMQLLHVVVLTALVLSCGILAAAFGNKFLSPLMKFLESIPPIG